jgi:histone H3/H4
MAMLCSMKFVIIKKSLIFFCKLPYQHLVREILQITQNSSMKVKHLQATSILDVQEYVEAFIMHLLEDANLCAIHAKRVDFKPKTHN